MSDEAVCAVILWCLLIGALTLAIIAAVVLAAAAVALFCVFAVGRAVWFFIADRLPGRVELVEYERDTAIADIVRLRQRATRLMLEVASEDRAELRRALKRAGR